MRLAKVEDFKRNASNKKYSTRVNSIVFESHSYFVNQTPMTFYNPTIILGKNGSGKTRLLKILEGALKGHNRVQYDLRDRFSIRVDYSADGQNYIGHVYRHHQGNTNHTEIQDIDALYINAADIATDSVKWINSESNFDELIDQYEAYIFTSKQLDIINHCANKRYRKIEAYSVNDIDIPMVYFIVHDNTKIYGTESMGTGELCILTIFFQIKQSQKGMIILIEEPENYVTYASQVALMSIFRHFMLVNDNFFIVSTHSAGILIDNSRSNVIMLYESGKYIEWKSSPTDMFIKDIVGISILPKITIHVEDNFASVFLKSILYTYLPEIYQEIEINYLGSESNLKGIIDSNLLDSLKNNIVCFDGDCRSKYASDSKVIFLPGNVSPEEVILDFVKFNSKKFCAFANINHLNFTIALSNASSVDRHEAISSIAKFINLAYNFLAQQFCDYYSQNNPQLSENDIIKRVKEVFYENK